MLSVDASQKEAWNHAQVSLIFPGRSTSPKRRKALEMPLTETDLKSIPAKGTLPSPVESLYIPDVKFLIGTPLVLFGPLLFPFFLLVYGKKVKAEADDA